MMFPSHQPDACVYSRRNSPLASSHHRGVVPARERNDTTAVTNNSRECSRHAGTSGGPLGGTSHHGSSGLSRSQQRKQLVTTVCILLVMVACINAVSVVYTLNYDPDTSSYAASTTNANSNNIRATKTASTKRGLADETIFATTDDGAEFSAPGAPDSSPSGVSAGMQQLMQEQTTLIESVREQVELVQHQNEHLKMMHSQQQTQEVQGEVAGEAAHVTAQTTTTALEAPQVVGEGPAQEETLAGYKDSWEAHEESDIPVFWHIPRTGGSTIKQVMQGCHKKTLATEIGVTDGHDQDGQIEIVHYGRDPNLPFVNIDTTTRDGIARAGQMGFAQSGLTNVAMATPLVHDTATLFDPQHRGRLFAIIREPIERSVSTFAHLQRGNPQFATMTVEEYAQSPLVENNWMTRYLSNTIEGELNDSHLQVAMDVARRKLLVGLRHRFDESIERFERFFGWRFDDADAANREGCRSGILSSTGANAQLVAYPTGNAYELLRWQNQYDTKLYNYLAETLFDEQDALVRDFPDRFGRIPALPLPQVENQQQEQKGGNPDATIIQLNTALAAGDIPPYVCEDRHPEGFTEEPLPNPFPLLCGATRPCYDNFAPFPSEPNANDVPAFWHVPKAGGSTIKDIVGHCMGLTQADEVGVRNGHDADTTLQIVEEENNYFVNVDTSQPDGMRKARELGLAPSGLADLATIVNIQDADYMFDPNHRGKLFSVFRHPVERAISMFYYLSKADWEPTYRPEYANMTLLEYTSRGGPVENNFMVRFLVNQRRGPVGEEQLEFAKKVLKEKFVIGLLHETKESWRRFQKYFGFKPRPGMDEAAVNECIQGYLGGGSNQNAGKKTKMDELDPTSEVSRKLHNQNNMDIKLYEYALEIWDQQAQFFED